MVSLFDAYFFYQSEFLGHQKDSLLAMEKDSLLAMGLPWTMAPIVNMEALSLKRPGRRRRSGGQGLTNLVDDLGAMAFFFVLGQLGVTTCDIAAWKFSRVWKIG